MQDNLRKAPFRCPHCEYVQLEPVTAISTYCRSCGSYYEIGAPVTGKEKPAPAPAAPRSQPTAAQRHVREVRCYRCRRTHEVSASARSTICPGCSASIEFDDIIFDSKVARPVDTRGRLIVEAKGSLSNGYIVCGEADIRGEVNGTLRCEGTVRIAYSGIMSCRIAAKSIVIEKGARLDFPLPLIAAEIILHGSARGNFHCEGQVHVHRHGRLEGRLTARAVVVEKGGFLLADSTVQPASPIQKSEKEAPEKTLPLEGLTNLGLAS
ncbi:protein CcmA, bactofilin family [Terrimicrobium sacchariphilum]|uniref:Protein CcmA, bactofilin family n=1 Tax=Terrimicrobium sacchariphilum TaxID=690879 RepID=A0A146G8E0_TERSA|nr:polymer-forming cytoskeletal protein [Terrimicrobium sacchariphilum]GAT33573.1 protein CcmA, bactofilin family [Terrimicrobium sacchariphilum]